MPIITLVEGCKKEFARAVSVNQIAATLGGKLQKEAIAAEVDGRLVDLDYIITTNSHVTIITLKDPKGLEIIRHSTAHLLAQAVTILFPGVKMAIGPVIENGFYYDFDYHRAFTSKDLTVIEAKMQELVKRKLHVKRQVMTRQQAMAFFDQQHQPYKVEIIADIAGDEEISLYSQGNFTDLCCGPHVPNTSYLKAFKLTKVAGAYWQGDACKPMLHRIYGTAWASHDDLQRYLEHLAEATKRDHRKIAKQMDLFHMQPLAPGMVFWHSCGWQIFQTIEHYMRQKARDNGYQEVKTPQIIDQSLWQRSGHWDNYRDEMFTTQSEKRLFAIKPMSCPGHIEIFKQGLKSYRDLPLRMMEFGCCHRNELSGTLHGLMRVRNFVQDDAHIFCTEQQLQQEVERFITLLLAIYHDFGFNDIKVALSTRPLKRVGDDSLWDKAEHALREALQLTDMDWVVKEGDGAFYGPKIDFSFKDCLQRVWQLGTLQLDYCLPERLRAQYVTKEGSKKTPIMLHRAVLGSIERFIGILLEHYGGKLPLWLAPIQVALLTIFEKQADYANEVARQLKKHHIRVAVDLRNEKIGFKIREFTLKNVPYLVVIGDRERQLQKLSIRTYNNDKLENLTVDSFIDKLHRDIKHYK